MLVLEPELTRIVAFASKSLDLQQTRIRNTNSNVRVNDGETISIAGLLPEEEPLYHILVLK